MGIFLHKRNKWNIRLTTKWIVSCPNSLESLLWRQVHRGSANGGNRVLNKADWVSDHKHGASCEFPPSIGAFSKPGAPQPSRDPVLTLFAETREEEKELHDGVRERFVAQWNSVLKLLWSADSWIIRYQLLFKYGLNRFYSSINWILSMEVEKKLSCFPPPPTKWEPLQEKAILMDVVAIILKFIKCNFHTPVLKSL